MVLTMGLNSKKYFNKNSNINTIDEIVNGSK